MRHGRPTLWARHGVRAALVAGDAMSALAYLTLVDGSRSVPPVTLAAMMRCLQEAHFRMCEGQAFDIGFETATFVTFDEYVRMIEGKTAALLAVACELGAWAAGATDERAPAYSNVGRAYGLAFQVRDDVLGTWGRTEETGKPSGADIRRRKWSFPVAWALAQPPSADRAIVADAYATIGMLDDDARHARDRRARTPRRARRRRRSVPGLHRRSERDLRRPRPRPRRPPRCAFPLHGETHCLADAVGRRGTPRACALGYADGIGGGCPSTPLGMTEITSPSQLTLRGTCRGRIIHVIPSGVEGQP